MKFVIFDIDGTLADTTAVDDKCFIRTFYNVFRVDLSSQDWSEIQHVTDWGITEEIIQREFGRLPTDEEYHSMESQLVDDLQLEKKNDPSQFSEVPGGRDFVQLLQDSREFQVGIATGAWEGSAKVKLDGVGIDPSDMCFSNSSHHKSREDITLDVIKKLQADLPLVPEDITYFGDGVWDFKTCNNLGINFIGVDVKNNGKLRALGAKNVYADFSDAHKILSHIRI